MRASILLTTVFNGFALSMSAYPQYAFSRVTARQVIAPHGSLQVSDNRLFHRPVRSTRKHPTNGHTKLPACITTQPIHPHKLSASTTQAPRSLFVNGHKPPPACATSQPIHPHTNLAQQSPPRTPHTFCPFSFELRNRSVVVLSTAVSVGLWDYAASCHIYAFSITSAKRCVQ